MSRMEALGIQVPTRQGERFDCPLCSASSTLVVEIDEVRGWWWACSNCFQTGADDVGWHETNNLEQGYVTFYDLSDELRDVYTRGLERGIQLEWPSIHNLYSVRRGEWTLVTGMPSHGKSEFVDSLLISLAIEHDWKIAMFSPENMPHKIHASKLIEKLVGLPTMPTRQDRMSWQDFSEAQAILGERFFFVYPKKKSIEDILAIVELLVKKHGISGAVIDPWNEIEHQRPQGLSETEYISQVLSRIRGFARAKNIHIWLVAHPTKMMRDKSGHYPVPRPYDVSGSAHFYNKADNCLTIWRDAGHEDEDKRNTVEIHVQKIRFKITGKVGVCELNYERASGRFIDPCAPYKGPTMIENYRSKNSA